jgi:hypothetical protein
MLVAEPGPHALHDKTPTTEMIKEAANAARIKRFDLNFTHSGQRYTVEPAAFWSAVVDAGGADKVRGDGLDDACMVMFLLI